jgi:8-oxo-dGTP pyrophosphatase MutT (NUDIX family)
VKQQIERILAGRKKTKIGGENLKASAVLIPLFCKQGQYHLLFTERSDAVDSHKGQVCFPGGKHEAFDSSLLQTALRETEEEISLRAADVEILGELDDTPPLSFLTDEANFEEDSYSYQYEGHLIWGATARILRQFIDLLKPESGARQ